MPRIGAERLIAGAQPHDVAALWWDPARWPSFVEGFSHVRKREEPWPEAGGRLVWDARPQSDRGRVIEQVLRRDPQHAEVALEDARLQGTQRVAFTPARDGTLTALELEYTLKGPAAAIVDLAYARRAIRRGLDRTLERLAREVAMERELAADVE
jgi:Polyketide cyclase / dehydrase and lipid transport